MLFWPFNSFVLSCLWNTNVFFFCLSFEVTFKFVVVEVKFGFLCDFLWEMRSFWSFNSFVLGC